MARVLTQATMPHSDHKICTFKRSNGNFSLSILGHPEVGLPYGTYPRLILNWLVTEAVRTKTPELILGSNLNKFLDELGLKSTGGRWGSITRLRDQMRRLFSSSISCTYKGENHLGGIGFNIAKEYHLWWDPKKPQQTDLWKSKVILGLDFFNEIVDRPIPIDMRAIKSLKKSSLAIDLYCWLVYCI